MDPGLTLRYRILEFPISFLGAEPTGLRTEVFRGGTKLAGIDLDV